MGLTWFGVHGLLVRVGLVVKVAYKTYKIDPKQGDTLKTTLLLDANFVSMVTFSMQSVYPHLN